MILEPILAAVGSGADRNNSTMQKYPKCVVSVEKAQDSLALTMLQKRNRVCEKMVSQSSSSDSSLPRPVLQCGISSPSIPSARQLTRLPAY